MACWASLCAAVLTKQSAARLLTMPLYTTVLTLFASCTAVFTSSIPGIPAPLRSHAPTRFDRPIHLSSFTAQDTSHSFRNALPRAGARAPKPYKNPLNHRHHYPGHAPISNVSYQTERNPFRWPPFSNRYHRGPGAQLRNTFLRDGSIPQHKATRIYNRDDQFVFKTPRNPLFSAPFTYTQQARVDPGFSWSFEAGTLSLPRHRSYPARAIDNPRLLKDFLNMLYDSYHSPTPYNQIPPPTLYWDPQSIQKDSRKAKRPETKLRSKRNFYPTTKHPRGLLRQPRRVESIQRTRSEYRPRYWESRNGGDHHPNKVYVNTESRLIGKRRIGSNHFTNRPLFQNLYTDRRVRTPQTHYREIYLRNRGSPSRRVREKLPQSIERSTLHTRKPEFIDPVQSHPNWRLPKRMRLSPRQSSSYRERYLEMLRQRRVKAEQLKSQIKIPRTKPQDFPQFQESEQEQLRHRPTNLRERRKQLLKTRFPPDTQRQDNTFSDYFKRHRPQRQNLDTSWSRRIQQHRPNHRRLNPQTDFWQPSPKRPNPHRSNTSREFWPSAPNYTLHRDLSNVTRHRLIELINNIDWRKIQNDCWHYNGFNSRLCQNITKFQQWTTTESSQEWPDIYRKTTSLPPKFPIQTTAVPATETKPWKTLQTTAIPNTAVDVTTPLPTLTTAVTLGDRGGNPRPQGYKQWLKERCGVTASPFIIGGRRSRPGRWPWQASLQIVASAVPWHRCGGALIHPRWVLTAAHCMEGPFNGNVRNWRVVLADHDLDVVSGQEVYRKIIRIINHPGYVEATNYPDDVALLELDSPVDIASGDIQVACLPDINFDLSPGTECWVSGWGETRGSGGQEGDMNELRLRIMDTGQCRTMWDRVDVSVLDTQVCVGDGITGACYGDSGGPLMCESQGRVYVAGVMSWLVENCSGPNFPNVFTRLPSYLHWLDEQLDFYQDGWWS